MKVKFTKLAALLLAGVALFATGCTDYEVDIQRNADAIANANSQIAALQATIATLETAANHQADVDKLNKAITDLESSLKSLIDKKADQAALDAAINRIKAIEDADFQKQIDDLKADIAKMATKAELEKAVADLTKLINDEISKLEARVAATEAAIKKINEETIPGINQQIEALKTKNGEQDETIRLLKEAVDNLSKVYATKAELKDEVDKIMKALEGYATTEALETAINEALAAISDVKGAIRSLVFVPEVYVDGVEAILVSTLNYNPLLLQNPDSLAEVAVPDTASVNVTPIVTAKYHVIPSDADLSFLTEGDTVKFVLRAEDPFIVSRAAVEPTEDFTVTGIYRGRDKVEADVIDIEVKVTGKPAEGDLISVVALQLQNGTEIYTSDYATIYSQEIAELRIADPTNEEDAHYRRATEVISETDDEAFISDVAAWTEAFDTLSVDHQMAYDEAFDLKKYVVAHFLGEEELDSQETECAGANEKIFEGLGFTWKFELVENYEIGDSEMFDLTEDGVLTAKDGNAINLTPIVRVTIVDPENDDNNVQIAYVKVWVAPSDKETSIYWSEGGSGDVKDHVVFECEGDSLVADSTVLYKKIYDLFPITKTNFDAAYPEFVASYDAEVDTIGTVTYDPESGELVWFVPAEDIWPIASDPNLKDEERVLTHNVAFVAENGAEVVVALKADVEPVDPYKIPVEKYIKNYWNESLTAAQYNVFTPDYGEKDSTKCVFHNNINAAFITDDEGVIDLTGIGREDLEVTNIKYFFCDDMEDITKIGDYNVTFTVEDGTGTRTDVNGVEFDVEGYNTILKAKIDTVEAEIAYICNDADEKELTPNVVVLVKDLDPNHIAKKLLNTDEFYVLLGATGMICGDEGFEVNLWWQHNPGTDEDWLDHFQADYIQPVKVTDIATDNFVDAVDFGQEGSFITLKDLVAPKDWRGRVFGMNEGDQYYNYWDYYGIFKISVDVEAITCDLTPDKKVPVTIILEPKSKEELKASLNVSEAMRDAEGNIMKDDEGNVITIGAYIDGIDDGGFGFLTYRNNGTYVKAFKLFVPVTVQYGWGIISTPEPITVNVATTIKED